MSDDCCPGGRMSEVPIARIAGWMLWSLLATAVLILLIAAASGIVIEIAPGSAIVAALLIVLLVAAHRRYRRRGERRLALALGGLLSISLAGSAGGVISIVGQAFAFPMIDPWLAAVDGAFGLSSLSTVGVIAQLNGAPEFLGAAYLSSIPLVIISVLALALLNRSDRMWELCAAFGFCMLVATITCVPFPAEGAFSFLQFPAELKAALPAGSGVYHLTALADLRESGVVKLDAADLQGLVTFPSFHTAMAFMTAAAWRDDRWLRWPMLGWNALVVLSTIPIGGHYFVDLAGGALCWMAIYLVCQDRASQSAALRREAEPALAG